MAIATRPSTDTRSFPRRWTALLPGIAASLVVSVLAVGLDQLQARVFGRVIVEAIVLAILVGMVVRAARGARAGEEPGVRFVATEILGLAVCLLGATMDVTRLFASGPLLAVGIVALVCVTLACGYVIGRVAGLPSKLAVLVACGNSICGNSAIAAVAPVIDADHEDVAAAIALSAVLGVAMVLWLPLLIKPFGLSNYQYGALAGLTIYAVPQVLAAGFAVSAVSGQVATAVKLARVLMLGPVVLFFSMRRARTAGGAHKTISLGMIAPWFVLGFLLLAALRSVGAIGDPIAAGAKSAASWLTIAAMAALGLTVDVRSMRRVGGRVSCAVGGALVVLVVLALALIKLLALP